MDEVEIVERESVELFAELGAEKCDLGRVLVDVDETLVKKRERVNERLLRVLGRAVADSVGFERVREGVITGCCIEKTDILDDYSSVSSEGVLGYKD